MDLLGKKVLVAGCGKSGLGAAGLLQKAGAVPVLFDENEKLDGKALCAREDYPKDTALVLGSLPKELLSELSLAVLSPGISIEEAFVSTLEEADIPVWGEIELAWNYEKGKVLAITGTNGKTTTTTLVGEILKRYQDNTFVVGNIGTPYTQEVLKTDKDSVTVAEISSFQLETAVHFHPTVSAILNITPDHLNRHHTMENYAAVKESITKNQTKDEGWDRVLIEIGIRPGSVYYNPFYDRVNYHSNCWHEHYCSYCDHHRKHHHKHYKKHKKHKHNKHYRWDDDDDDDWDDD